MHYREHLQAVLGHTEQLYEEGRMNKSEYWTIRSCVESITEEMRDAEKRDEDHFKIQP